MANQSIVSRNAAQGDPVEVLLAKLLGSRARGTLLSSATRTINTSTASIDMTNWKGLLVFWDISAASGTGGLLLRLEHQDPVTLTWNACATIPAAVRTTTGMLVVQFANQVGSVVGGTISNASFLNTVMSNVRLTVTHADASSYTYSLGYEQV